MNLTFSSISVVKEALACQKLADTCTVLLKAPMKTPGQYVMFRGLNDVQDDSGEAQKLLSRSG